MKKLYVNSLNVSWNSTEGAEHVVAHAKWQRSRGRKPSLSFKGERNPRKALDLALRSLLIYESRGGYLLSGVIDSMIRIADLTGNTCSTTFNHVSFTVNPGDNPSEIAELYRYRSKQRAEEYTKRLREQGHEAISELNSLDFSDLAKVIKWLEKAEGASTMTGFPSSRVVKVFTENGFEPNANTGELDEEDENNYARWLITQAIKALGKSQGINPFFSYYAEIWLYKFGYNTEMVSAEK